MQIPRLPLGRLVELLINWMQFNLGGVFGVVSGIILHLDGFLRDILLSIPSGVLIGLAGAVAFRRLGLRAGLLTSVGLFLIWDLRFWKAAMETLSLVVVAGGMSLLVGIPAGILIAENRSVQAVATPILDYMQTTPSFVYLIPNVMFFGLGTVPAVLATMMFAIPPPTRITALGIQQVDSGVVEAGEAFGCSRWQLLHKIKLPLASPSILLGINQCVMMTLSMVVIGSLIGAHGLGTLVIQSIAQVNIGQGIEGGVAIVILAIVLDRLIRGAVRGREDSIWL